MPMMKRKNGIDPRPSAGRENNNHENENETAIDLSPNVNGMVIALVPNANGMVIDLALSESVKITAPEPTGNAEMPLHEKVFVLPVRDSARTVPDRMVLGLRSVTGIRRFGTASKETAPNVRCLLPTPTHVGTTTCGAKWNNCAAKLRN